MTNQFALTDSETQLLLDLLREYRRELPTEIRHTDSPRVHDALKKRVEEVDALIHKLEPAEVKT